MCSVIEPETSIRQNITAWAIGFGVGSNRRYLMSIGSLVGIRLALAFSSSILACISTRRAAPQFSGAASRAANSGGRRRRNATRRANARLTVRLIEILAGEPE